MSTIMDLLAELLNPNPGQNRLVNPNANGPNYLTQTGLGPEQLARFHQMSGMGGQAAPATSMPQAAPQGVSMPQQAPQADQTQTASVGPMQGQAQGGGAGGFFGRLFGGGQSAGENQTIQWLQQQGMDAGTATMLAKSKPALQQYLLQRSQGPDPKDALQAEKLNLEVENLRHPQPGSDWSKMDDGRLFNQRTGEVKTVGDPGGGGQFEGTSVEAQSLNYLVKTGQLTPDQAAQLGAGKTVTNPADGSLVFLTPRGIFSQPAAGGPATPLSPPPAGTPPAAAAPAAPAAGVPAAPPTGSVAIAPDAYGAIDPQKVPPISDAATVAGQPPANPGMIQITGAKPSGKKTESEERYTAISNILVSEVPTLGANFKAMSDPTGQLLSKIPGGLGNMWQSEEYQRAASAVKTSVSSILYALSGASSNPGEVINQIGVLTPEFGDKPGLIADKLQRFKVYVRAVASGTGDPKLKAMVEDAIGKMDTPSAAPAASGKVRQIAPGITIERLN